VVTASLGVQVITAGFLWGLIAREGDVATEARGRVAALTPAE
jgi:hypothetical protein